MPYELISVTPEYSDVQSWVLSKLRVGYRMRSSKSPQAAYIDFIPYTINPSAGMTYQTSMVLANVNSGETLWLHAIPHSTDMDSEGFLNFLYEVAEEWFLAIDKELKKLYRVVAFTSTIYNHPGNLDEHIVVQTSEIITVFKNNAIRLINNNTHLGDVYVFGYSDEQQTNLDYQVIYSLFINPRRPMSEEYNKRTMVLTDEKHSNFLHDTIAMVDWKVRAAPNNVRYVFDNSLPRTKQHPLANQLMVDEDFEKFADDYLPTSGEGTEVDEENVTRNWAASTVASYAITGMDNEVIINYLVKHIDLFLCDSKCMLSKTLLLVPPLLIEEGFIASVLENDDVEDKPEIGYRVTYPLGYCLRQAFRKASELHRPAVLD